WRHPLRRPLSWAEKFLWLRRRWKAWERGPLSPIRRARCSPSSSLHDKRRANHRGHEGTQRDRVRFGVQVFLCPEQLNACLRAHHFREAQPHLGASLTMTQAIAVSMSKVDRLMDCRSRVVLFTMKRARVK